MVKINSVEKRQHYVFLLKKIKICSKFKMYVFIRGGEKVKRKIFLIAFAAMLVFSGCSKEEQKQPEKKPVQSEEVKDPIKDEEQDDLEDDDREEEQKLEVYYIDELTGKIAEKDEVITGELSEAIVSKLKETAVLSQECEIEVISVNESEEKMEIAVNSGFGEYIRSMGTSGESLVLECVVRTYSEAYDCDGVKITENGNPLETGHAVFDGYISYE